MKIETLHSAIDMLEGYEKCPRCDERISQLPIGAGGPECSCGFSWHTGPESKWLKDHKKGHIKPSHYAFVTVR